MDVDLDERKLGCDNGISRNPSSTTTEQQVMEEEKYRLDANTESKVNCHSQDMLMQIDNHVTQSQCSELGKIVSSSQSPVLGLNCTLPEFPAEVLYFLLSEHYFLLRYIGV